MEELARKYLTRCDEKSATDLVCMARCSNLFNLGSFLGDYLSRVFPHNAILNLEYSANLYHAGKPRDSYAVCKKVLDMRNLSFDLVKQIMMNRRFNIPHIQDDHNYYNPGLVTQIINRKPKAFALVSFTMTTCKRFDLFVQTMNTFINCCSDLDLIDYWYCVDDNSSDEDRRKMRDLYPFMKFVFKTPDQKGHPQSMNILKSMVFTPYVFHLEDDWKFFEVRKYISELLEILGQDERFGQALVNKNYSETSKDIVPGGEPRVTQTGLRYYVHEYARTEEEKHEFVRKHGTSPNSNYWPHFSLRASLVRTRVLRELGDFNTKVSHFEMEYAHRYYNAGYTSAFLEGTYCLHTGRLTSERNDLTKPNAYTLNNEAQFSGKEEQIPVKTEPLTTVTPTVTPTVTTPQVLIRTFVVNLDKRPDRWTSFCSKPEPKFLQYERFSAVDGSKLIPTVQLQQIFDNNDYNMRRGMVGCAMSHIKLMVNLLNEDRDYIYCILEDDIDFVPDFSDKFVSCVQELMKVDWDLFYLGHHLWPQYITEEVHSKTIWPRIEKMTRGESLKRSMGGTIGYLISKTGARKLLEYINETGMTNGIDTVQQKSADTLDVYYAYPHLVYSECFRGNNHQTLDTDIQFNFESLTIPIDKRLDLEKEYYGILPQVSKNDLDSLELSVLVGNTPNFYHFSQNKADIRNLKKKCDCLKIPSYTLGDQVLVVANKPPEKSSESRYHHRFRKNNRWSVEDAIKV